MHVKCAAQAVVARQQGLQLGQAADGAQVADGAVLTVQIGQRGAVGQASDCSQVGVVVALELSQRGTARHNKVGQVVAPAVQALQVRVTIHPKCPQGTVIAHID